MNAITRRIFGLGCAVLLAGCLSPKYTQLPTLRPQPDDYAYHNPSFIYHNPLPDRDAGPTVELPRGYDRERSVPTRTLERAAITKDILQRDGVGSSTNPAASNYPASVSE